MSMATDIDEYVTVKEAADLIGVQESRVRQLLLEGVLVGRKFGQRAWMVRRDSASEFRNNRPRRGPKPKHE